MITYLTRATRITACAVRHLGAHWGWKLLRREPVPGPQRLRLFLEQIGGTFLKFGQVLALQPDILPMAYCDALFDLLDRVPSFSFAEVEQTFLDDLGKRPHEVFTSFGQAPIASASIGQVHVATLGEQKLAVKVRRPNVEEQFGTDLRLMSWVAGVIERTRLRPLHWLAQAIREFSTWTHEELDYRCEARFMAALAHNARDNPNEAVPEVLHELSTSRILVSEFLEGPMVLDYIRCLQSGDAAFEERLAASGFDAEVFASHIVENFVWDAFQHGLFHADLHPANLLILPDNVVGYVDFGITGSLSRHSRRNIVAMTLALTRAESEDLAAHFFRIATAEGPHSEAAFRQALDERMQVWFDRRGDELVQRTSWTRVMIDFLKMSRRTGIWAMPDALRYLRSVITADGLVHRFAPETDVSQDLQRLCELYLERELWQRWLSPESLADWTSAAARLISAAPAAVTAALRDTDESVHDRPVLPAARRRRPDRGTTQRAALQYGLVAVVAATLAVSGTPPLEFGLNTATAALVVALCGVTMGIISVLRPGGADTES